MTEEKKVGTGCFGCGLAGLIFLVLIGGTILFYLIFLITILFGSW